jgi:hypothetical protein
MKTAVTAMLVSSTTTHEKLTIIFCQFMAWGVHGDCQSFILASILILAFHFLSFLMIPSLKIMRCKLVIVRILFSIVVIVSTLNELTTTKDKPLLGSKNNVNSDFMLSVRHHCLE